MNQGLHDMTIDILLNPNVAYVLLVGGFLMAILALFAPGTGIIELIALFAIVLAGISIYYLPTNTWALIILIIGIIPFLLALRYSHKYIYLTLATIALIVGSLFLFKPRNGVLAIDPILAVFVSVVAVGFMWFIGTKGVEAASRKPVHDMERLIGMVGVAETEILEEGTVHIDGENWTARSQDRIPERAHVRVISREGLVLIVELADRENI